MKAAKYQVISAQQIQREIATVITCIAAELTSAHPDHRVTNPIFVIASVASVTVPIKNLTSPLGVVAWTWHRIIYVYRNV